ncbi:hypothetical protein ABVK25_009355 [Lepraria finkii]|uniref:Uncharacterized protein n=1 Tax=Lepraria finkii TaxID=1340010 RepID=A0ABR4AXI8_9LECA
MSMKIFNVKGEKLEGTSNGKISTQDFFWNYAPMIELTDIHTCLEIMALREKYFDNPTGLFLALKTQKILSSNIALACYPTLERPPTPRTRNPPFALGITTAILLCSLFSTP